MPLRVSARMQGVNKMTQRRNRLIFPGTDKPCLKMKQLSQFYLRPTSIISLIERQSVTSIVQPRNDYRGNEAVYSKEMPASAFEPPSQPSQSEEAGKESKGSAQQAGEHG